MEKQQLYTRFPTEITCVTFLEQIRWNGHIICPHCNGSNVTAMPNEQRHHCNRCKTSFSVTVKTIFHKSRVDLRKWVLATMLYTESDKVSAQHLSRVLGVQQEHRVVYEGTATARRRNSENGSCKTISKGVRV